MKAAKEKGEVYKAEELENGDTLRQLSVSYTHLDVYKRQAAKAAATKGVFLFMVI